MGRDKARPSEVVFDPAGAMFLAKMKVNLKRVVQSAVAVFLLFAANVWADLKTDVAGDWESADGYSLTLADDGSCVILGEEKGRWSLPDETHLRVEFDDAATNPITWQIHLEDDTLTLTPPGGKTRKLARAKAEK